MVFLWLEAHILLPSVALWVLQGNQRTTVDLVNRKSRIPESFKNGRNLGGQKN